MLFVTHNVREAVRLGDRVILLSSRPGRIAHEYTIDIPRPRRIDSPEVAGLAAEITDRLREEVRRHGDDNRADGRRDDRRDLAGLDALELAVDPDPSPCAADLGAPCGRSSARSRIALFVWQCVVWSGWKPEYVLPGPATVLPTAVAATSTRSSTAPRSRCARAVVGFAIAVVIGTALGALIARSRILRSAVGVDGHEPHDDAVDRVVPGRDRALRAQRGVRSGSSS